MQRIFGVIQLRLGYRSCNKAAGLITVARYMWAQEAAARGRASRREEIVNRTSTIRGVGWVRLIAGGAIIGLLCNAGAWAADPDTTTTTTHRRHHHHVVTTTTTTVATSAGEEQRLNA